MVFGEKSPEKFEKAKSNLSKLSTCMYVPQVVMLIIAFTLGVYIPKFLDIVINNTLIG